MTSTTRTRHSTRRAITSANGEQGQATRWCFFWRLPLSLLAPVAANTGGLGDAKVVTNNPIGGSHWGIPRGETAQQRDDRRPRRLRHHLEPLRTWRVDFQIMFSVFGTPDTLTIVSESMMDEVNYGLLWRRCQQRSSWCVAEAGLVVTSYLFRSGVEPGRQCPQFT